MMKKSSQQYYNTMNEFLENRESVFYEYLDKDYLNIRTQEDKNLLEFDFGLDFFQAINQQDIK
jgi:hypothetical protein